MNREKLGQVITLLLFFAAGYIIGMTLVNVVVHLSKKDEIQCIKDGSCRPYVPPEQIMQAAVKKLQPASDPCPSFNHIVEDIKLRLN